MCFNKPKMPPSPSEDPKTKAAVAAAEKPKPKVFFGGDQNGAVSGNRRRKGRSDLRIQLPSKTAPGVGLNAPQ